MWKWKVKVLLRGQKTLRNVSRGHALSASTVFLAWLACFERKYCFGTKFCPRSTTHGIQLGWMRHEWSRPQTNWNEIRVASPTCTALANCPCYSIEIKQCRVQQFASCPGNMRPMWIQERACPRFTTTRNMPLGCVELYSRPPALNIIQGWLSWVQWISDTWHFRLHVGTIFTEEKKFKIRPFRS